MGCVSWSLLKKEKKRKGEKKMKDEKICTIEHYSRMRTCLRLICIQKLFKTPQILDRFCQSLDHILKIEILKNKKNCKKLLILAIRWWWFPPWQITWIMRTDKIIFHSNHKILTWIIRFTHKRDLLNRLEFGMCIIGF